MTPFAARLALPPVHHPRRRLPRASWVSSGLAYMLALGSFFFCTGLAQAQTPITSGQLAGSILTIQNNQPAWIDPCAGGLLVFSAASIPSCSTSPIGNLTLPTLAITGAGVNNSNSSGQLAVGGALTYSDIGISASFNNNVNSYNQVISNNTNAGAAASADFIVSNNSGSSNTYYGDFGINSSGWIGTGGFGLASETYLYSANGALAIGTFSNMPIHFVTNNSNTDSMTIDPTAGITTVATLNVGGALSMGTLTHVAISATAPTFTSGACVGAIGTTNGTAAFTFTTGSGSCTNTAVLGMPTAANGWVCSAFDEAIAGASQIQETADTVNSVTLTTFTIGTTPVAGPFTASHTVKLQCTGY